MITEIVLSGGGELLHQHQVKVARLVGGFYRKTRESQLSSTWRPREILTNARDALMEPGTKGEKTIIPPLHWGAQNTRSFSSLPQLHADELTNTNRTPLDRKLVFHFINQRRRTHTLLTTLRRNGGVKACLTGDVSQVKSVNASGNALVFFFFFLFSKAKTVWETKGNRASR